MFNNSTMMSPADYAAISNNNDGFGGNGSWAWILIILICLFGGWGNNGWGNGNSGAAENYVLASDFATLQRQIDTATDGLRQQGVQISNGLCDGFYTQAQLVNGVNTNIANASQNVLAQMNNNAINAMQDTFALQTAINGINVNANTNTQAVLAQMNNNESARQACCCETNNLLATSFGNLKYDMAAQDCQIRQTVNDVGRNLVDVQNENTRSILAAIQSIKDDAKDEKIATLTAQISDMKLIANNEAQTVAFTNAINAAVHQLEPKAPIASFNVPAPFPYGNTCGCNCNC